MHPCKHHPLPFKIRGMSLAPPLSTWKLFHVQGLLLILLIAIPSLRADDYYWTNQTSGDFTNANNWLTNNIPTSTPPGPSDNAYFTNDVTSLINWTTTVTNANAFFNPISGITTQAIGSSSWLITNSFIIGQTSGQTGSVSLSSGTLLITNATRSATLVVGSGGKGTFAMNGGTLVVDRLFVTNNGSSFTNSGISLNHGTLTTLSNSIIGISNDLVIGASAGNTLTWNVLGGVIRLNTLGSGVNSIGSGSGRGVVLVTGAGTIWSNAGGLYVGNSSSGNQLIISNGGVVKTGTPTSLIGASGNNNTVLVSDSGSSLTYQFVQIGNSTAVGNQLIISNGATVTSFGGQLGSFSGGNTNKIIVTGSGSSLNNGANGFSIGGASGVVGNQMILTNGGRAINSSGSIGTSGAALNKVIVTGNGTFWTNRTTLSVGLGGVSNELMVAAGAQVYSSTGTVGSASSATNSLATITDAGSAWTNTQALLIGSAGLNARLTITNGGTVYARSSTIGNNASGSGTIIITGSNSLLWLAGDLNVGSNGTTLGTGTIRILNQGTLEATNLVTGFNGTGVITNSGGIFQFSTSTPIITTNDLNSIILTNGTVSYRNVSAADIFNPQISNITFLGNNTFQLNAATNTSVTSYVFGTNNGGLYQHLTLLNGSSRWQSSTFTLGSGGIVSISNTTATVSGLFTNSGTVHVFNSKVTYENPVFISGGYLSDPSTNVFTTNVTVTSSGYLQAASGDVYQFERDLTLQSTQSNLFNLSGAIILFTNFGGAHLLDLTGSSALDRGTNGITTLNDVTNNFAIGTLQLFGAGDTLRVTGAVVNALYVGTLDLGALANTNNLFTDVNLYYDANLPANAYLARSTYDLPGNGMLIPYGVPEPGSLLFAMTTLGLLFRLGRRPTHPMAAGPGASGRASSRSSPL